MTGKKAGHDLVTLRRSQWVYLMIWTLLIGPFWLAVACHDEIYAAYVRTYVAPGVRRQFGFRVERQRMHYLTQPLDVFVIADTSPQGALAKAGVLNNDVPVTYIHMSDVGFYLKLRQSRGGPVEIRLANRDEYREWLKSGDAFPLKWRKVVIPRQALSEPPPPAGGPCRN